MVLNRRKTFVVAGLAIAALVASFTVASSVSSADMAAHEASKMVAKTFFAQPQPSLSSIRDAALTYFGAEVLISQHPEITWAMEACALGSATLILPAVAMPGVIIVASSLATSAGIHL
ncbi:MAG: hypothetical protein FD131_3263 [Rhodocyclaceae bacterium]|nr:MAG: hypothetical protein FD131_3263 [Rhodocyclaceae bacterium]